MITAVGAHRLIIPSNPAGGIVNPLLVVCGIVSIDRILQTSIKAFFIAGGYHEPLFFTPMSYSLCIS